MDPDAVDAVEPVVHGGADDPDLLEFSANVNPETPAGVERVYRDALADARRYPDDDYPAFRAAAAAHVGCDAAAVIPTAGGTGALRLALATWVSGGSVLVPAPSFGEYAREVALQGTTAVHADEATLLGRDPAPYDAVVVCTPNNPTGRLADADRLRAYAARCRDAGTTLVVDEAFLGFTDAPSLAGTPGTVVCRSLTKLFGLPGLRAGFAVATGEHGERLRRAWEPWALGTSAAAVGTHCLRQRGFVEATRERTARERDRLREGLADRFEIHPSDAPFLLLELPAGDDAGRAPWRDVDGLLAHAREAGIALRDARSFRGLDRHVRIAVRSPAENDRLLAALGGAGSEQTGEPAAGERPETGGDRA